MVRPLGCRPKRAGLMVRFREFQIGPSLKDRLHPAGRRIPIGTVLNASAARPGAALIFSSQKEIHTLGLKGSGHRMLSTDKLIWEDY